MSAFSRYAAKSERMTAVHYKTSARVLTIFTETVQAQYGSNDCFPVSGDMIATINRANRYQLTQRRRRAAALLSAQEAKA